ncbi:hypothetical protein EJ06DRAFT_255941 [Trichodelitschia bisporula]|uniref:Uncharacterized protein n=1 Tax=Trichodelitschia bisporula TaxID=703511 RepID=A0A6G1HIJ5_9PEZI|nr:hypothetical protein EJ06DRAFT_255941 [Trichodelitschia bisporula]
MPPRITFRHACSHASPPPSPASPTFYLPTALLPDLCPRFSQIWESYPALSSSASDSPPSSPPTSPYSPSSPRGPTSPHYGPTSPPPRVAELPFFLPDDCETCAETAALVAALDALEAELERAVLERRSARLERQREALEGVRGWRRGQGSVRFAGFGVWRR